MEAKQRLLLITCFFPPRLHTATQRTLAWIKYLDRSRFDIDVLCPCDSMRDVRALEDKYQIQIHQVNASNWPGILKINNHDAFWPRKLKALHNKFFVNTQVDEWPGFTQSATNWAKRPGVAETYSHVLSSFAPIGPHLVAETLKLKNPKIQWIADFRDEMSLGESVPWLVKRPLAALEKRFCQTADVVTAVSGPLIEEFQRHASSPSQKFLEIKNGYDFEPSLEKKPAGETLKIGYLGTLYGDINLNRFFAAWKAGLPTLSPKIELHIYGSGKTSPPLELAGHVKMHAPVEYSKIPEILSEMDAFLLIHPSGGRKGIYTTKIFDYLAVNRPILALVDPDDVAARLVLQSGSGWVQRNEDFSSQGLHKFLEFLMAFEKTNINSEFIRGLHRRNQVQILTDTL